MTTKVAIGKFSYHPKNRTLIAEASELGWNDIPNQFEIVGKENTLKFERTNRIVDDEGDVVAWTYIAVLKGISYIAKILND